MFIDPIMRNEYLHLLYSFFLRFLLTYIKQFFFVVILSKRFVILSYQRYCYDHKITHCNSIELYIELDAH